MWSGLPSATYAAAWVSTQRLKPLWRAKACSTLALTIMAAAWAADPAAGLEPGALPAAWLTGGPNCVSVPDWQVHEYNEDFYILRESGCINAEKPFLYLIFGEDKALLEDTGVASEVDGRAIPTAPVVLD